MSSFCRAAGASGLFLIALYATSVHFTSEGAGRRLFAENLRKSQSRQLDTVCDISGDYRVGDASSVGIQITQTGSSVETHYVGVDASFSGVVASDCTGHVNFGETEGDQAFSFDATTNVFTFSNYHGVYFTKVQGRATSSYQLVETLTYCADDWDNLVHMDLSSAGATTATSDECAQLAFNAGSECFLVYSADGPMKCVPCASCATTYLPSWDVSMYQLDSPSTPMPTSDGDTPMPTFGSPMPTASDTPMPTSGTPMPTASTPMPTSGTPMPTVGTPMPTAGTPMPTYSSGTPMPTDGSETPMPTTLMTPAPTWSSEIFEPFFANWGNGCQLNLNVDECQAYATQEGKAFEAFEQPDLPRGCMHQIPDQVIIFNKHAVWDQSQLTGLCFLDMLGAMSSCFVQMLCRPEDWVVEASSCNLGASLDQTMCERISASHNVWGYESSKGNDFTAQWSDRLPYGCYVDFVAGSWPTIGFNTNAQSAGVGLVWWDGSSESGTSAMCAKTAMTTSPTPRPTVFETPSPMPAFITKYMFIKNAHGICLDAKRRRDRGGTVHMWSCEQEACKDKESASFCAQGVAEGYCALAASASPMAAALSFQESCQRSCGVCLSPADQNRNQHWDFTYQEGQEFGTLKSHDGICLDASEALNGGKVWMWPCQPHNKRQMWTFDDSTQQLRSYNGYCLDARQRLTTGGKVHMWTCMPGNKNQKWQHILDSHDLDYYSPKLDYSKNILDVGHWDGPHHAACDVAGYYHTVDHTPDHMRASGVTVVLDANNPTKMEVVYDSGEVYPGTINRETCNGTVSFKIGYVLSFHYADGVILFANGATLVKG